MNMCDMMNKIELGPTETVQCIDEIYILFDGVSLDISRVDPFIYSDKITETSRPI